MPAALSILFASGNPGKLNEVRAVAERFGVEILSPAQVGASCPKVQESGATYRDNALLKADAFFTWSGRPSLADDSGLEVQSLAGAPGVLSARYAGEKASDAENRRKILNAMQGLTARRALFRCVLCLKLSAQESIFADGVLEGEIARSERGSAGFGYDSIFIVDGFSKTLAELKAGRDLPKTHRTNALEALFASLPRTKRLPPHC